MSISALEWRFLRGQDHLSNVNLVRTRSTPVCLALETLSFAEWYMMAPALAKYPRTLDLVDHLSLSLSEP